MCRFSRRDGTYRSSPAPITCSTITTPPAAGTSSRRRPAFAENSCSSPTAAPSATPSRSWASSRLTRSRRSSVSRPPERTATSIRSIFQAATASSGRGCACSNTTDRSITASESSRPCASRRRCAASGKSATSSSRRPSESRRRASRRTAILRADASVAAEHVHRGAAERPRARRTAFASCMARPSRRSRSATRRSAS